MVEKLYFLRHGVAYDREDWKGQDDALRPLTPDGFAAMKQEAQYLRKHGLKLDALVTSPLTRAHDTARIVGEALQLGLQISSLLDPSFNTQSLEQLFTQYPARRLMIVGHEPSFSTVMSALIGGGTIRLRKGGLARIEITGENPLAGRLEWLLEPEHLDA